MKLKIKIFIGILLILIVFLASYFVGFHKGKRSFEETGLIFEKENITYSKHFDSYYGINYGNNENGVFFEIQNPCLVFRKVVGQSMIPYYNNETIILIDTCFLPENLKIGDVILYYYDWNMTTTVHHRIVDINYPKEWIKTKGDNLNQTDNFINFNQIFGKEIGVLNILEDKKVVKEFFEEPLEQICVCSSNNILKVCYTDKDVLMNDSFVKENNLKEENCVIEE